MGARDVFLNCVGGVRLSEPAVDLAAALALAGVVSNQRLPDGCVVVGELGLAGEVRRVRRMEARLSEAHTLGLTTAILPAGSADPNLPGLRCLPVGRLSEAIALLR